MFTQVVAKARRVDDGEIRKRDIPEKVALILAGLFRHWRFPCLEAKDLEAAILEPVAFVILVSAEQDVCQARFSDAGRPLEIVFEYSFICFVDKSY